MSTNPASLSPPKTLQDVIERIAAMEQLSRQRRQDLCSAVRKIAGLLGRPARDVEVNVEAINRHIASLTPAMVGMTASRWKNVRSLLGAALKLTGTKVLRRRRAGLLPPIWRDLLDRVPDRFHRTRLCRFASFCAAEGVDPKQVDDAVADRFYLALKQDSLVERPSQIHRDACLAWNNAAGSLAGWPTQRLTIANRRSDYALPVSTYPDSFAADLDAYLDHLAGTDPFSETARQPSAPITIKHTRQRILQIAAAMVLSGRTPELDHRAGRSGRGGGGQDGTELPLGAQRKAQDRTVASLRHVAGEDRQALGEGVAVASGDTARHASADGPGPDGTDGAQPRPPAAIR